MVITFQNYREVMYTINFNWYQGQHQMLQFVHFLLLKFFGEIGIVFFQHNLQNFEAHHFWNIVEWLIPFYHQKPTHKCTFLTYGTFTHRIQLRYLIMYMRYGSTTVGPRICSIEFIFALLGRRKFFWWFLFHTVAFNDYVTF